MEVPIFSVSLPSLPLLDSKEEKEDGPPFGITLPILDRLSTTSWYTTDIVDRPIGLSILRFLGKASEMTLESEFYNQHPPSDIHADPHFLQQQLEDLEESSDEEDEQEASSGGPQRQNPTRKKKHINLSEEDLAEDWYEVLRVSQKDAATEAQLRQAYRQRCLETHPDKQPNHSALLFQKVQRAFDILIDPDIRLTYDSSRPFDDTIPGETVDENDFFETFSPVFERNKKWSTDHALPSLGSKSTPYEEVMKFYSRWELYRSWRDFSHMVELQEVGDDMCREEKRFYIRENERALAQYKKEEINRIKMLVGRAKKNDPRVRRHLEKEEAKRKKEREEKEALRQRIRNEAEKKRLCAAQEKKDMEEAAIREKEAAKKKNQELLGSLIDFFRSNNLLDDTPAKKLLPNAVRLVNIRWFMSKSMSSVDSVESLLRSVKESSTTLQPRSSSTAADGDEETTEVPAVLVFNQRLRDKEQELGVDRYGEPLKKRVDGGDAASSNRTPSLVQKPKAVWSEEDLGRLQKATAKYPPGTVDRWEKIATMLRGKFSEDDVIAKLTELTATLHAGGAANIASIPSSTTANTTSSSPNHPSSPPTAVSQSVEAWSVPQQKQLESGLQELKSYKEKDKFQKISKMVDGKNAKECFERYKFLCSLTTKK